MIQLDSAKLYRGESSGGGGEGGAENQSSHVFSSLHLFTLFTLRAFNTVTFVTDFSATIQGIRFAL